MKLSEKKNTSFTPHPETDGPIKAVLVDITDLKKRMTQYGEKDEFRLVFETEVMDEENDRRFCIWSRGYTPSLGEKAALRKDLKKLMGRDLTQAELDEFDLEALIGHGVKLIIQHETKDDRTYANISFMAPDKDKALKPSGKYTRIRDREVDGAAPEQKATGTSWESVIVHVGKYKGKALGEVDEAGVATLIEKWLPKAVADGKAEDKALAAALTELSALLGGDDY
ncbi:hypothetical protein UFOVP612_39 [uncultured Caudovirales phage]|uniref:Uncharacterized protein n=1 Tax=uncultured Caudovirales phage TaxID=2100421 RepID=A0A6J5N7F0_9CAUD|nr:hypothetical protein UFOVP612_39 [uncultured Caudovirales phage]